MALQGAPRHHTNPDAKYRYTTDVSGMQSNLEANDLAELMDMVLRPPIFAPSLTMIVPQHPFIAIPYPNCGAIVVTSG